MDGEGNLFGKERGATPTPIFTETLHKKASTAQAASKKNVWSLSINKTEYFCISDKIEGIFLILLQRQQNQQNPIGNVN